MKLEVSIRDGKAHFVRAKVKGQVVERRRDPASMGTTSVIPDRSRYGDMVSDVAHSPEADLAVKASLFTLAAGAFFASEAPVAKVLTGSAAAVTGLVTAATAYDLVR